MTTTPRAWRGSPAAAVRAAVASFNPRRSIVGDTEYEATLTSISYDNGTMTVKYNYPLDESAEVMLTAPVERDSATGTWSLRDRANGHEILIGRWKATTKAR